MNIKLLISLAPVKTLLGIMESGQHAKPQQFTVISIFLAGEL